MLLDKAKSDDKLVIKLRGEVSRHRGETPGSAGSRASGFYNSFENAVAVPLTTGSMADSGEVLQLRQRVTEQQDQIDKQQKIIGYLQVNQVRGVQ